MQLDTTISSSKLGLYVLPNHESCYLVAIQIKLQYIEISLLDMRALACFIDKNFAKQLNPKLMKKPFPTPIEAIDRWFLASKKFIEQTQLGSQSLIKRKAKPYNPSSSSAIYKTAPQSGAQPT